MKKDLILFISTLCLILAACEKMEKKSSPEKKFKQTKKSYISLSSDPSLKHAEDATLLEKIQASIQNDGALSESARAIRISVRDGIVTLKGTVANNTEKDAIANKVRQENGVISIDNRLEVKGRIWEGKRAFD